MRQATTVILILSLLAAILAPAERAEATPEREFIMSCTYGVMAGTLVGAASLAFSNKPGDSLQNVARGASIGLYIGIALGYYTAYVLPGQLEKDQENMINNATDGSQSRRFQIFPILVSNDLAPGLGAQWTF